MNNALQWGINFNVGTCTFNEMELCILKQINKVLTTGIPLFRCGLLLKERKNNYTIHLPHITLVQHPVLNN